jgi:hypothetical protein
VQPDQMAAWRRVAFDGESDARPRSADVNPQLRRTFGAFLIRLNKYRELTKFPSLAIAICASLLAAVFSKRSKERTVRYLDGYGLDNGRRVGPATLMVLSSVKDPRKWHSLMANAACVLLHTR